MDRVVHQTLITHTDFIIFSSSLFLILFRFIDDPTPTEVVEYSRFHCHLLAIGRTRNWWQDDSIARQALRWTPQRKTAVPENTWEKRSEEINVNSRFQSSDTQLQGEKEWNRQCAM